MRATFDVNPDSIPVIVLEPESDHERMLLALWLRYDENVIQAIVERVADHFISRVTLEASQP